MGRETLDIKAALNIPHSIGRCYVNRYHNLVFDLDGTLCDTAEDIIGCLVKAYGAAGLGTIRIPRDAIGPPLEEMIMCITPGINPTTRDLVVEQFRREYDACSYDATRMKEGAREILPLARDLGMKIFVVTNKPYRPTMRILKKLDVSDLDDVVSPDLFQPKRGKKKMLEHLLHKWGMESGKTIYVGDTESDIEAARDNSIISVFVIDGYGNSGGTVNISPDFRIDSLSELKNLLLA